MTRVFFGISVAWFLALGIYTAFYPHVAKSGFGTVPEKQRPSWSYMPLWFYRAMGVCFLATAGFFLYMFLRHP